MAGERVLPDEMTTEQLREKARGLAPNLSAAADGLSVQWSACILEALRALEGKRTANLVSFRQCGGLRWGAFVRHAFRRLPAVETRETLPTEP